MSPELMFWLALVTKMAIAALFVSAATVIAERLRAAAGAPEPGWDGANRIRKPLVYAALLGSKRRGKAFRRSTLTRR
jgi:hypothetical protein